MANSLLDFVMSVVRDPDVAAQYAADPAQAIADAHLTGVTTADVNGLIPIVTESVPGSASASPPSGVDVFDDGGNVWSSGAATAAFDAFDSSHVASYVGDHLPVAGVHDPVITDPIDQHDVVSTVVDTGGDLNPPAGGDDPGWVFDEPSADGAVVDAAHPEDPGAFDHLHEPAHDHGVDTPGFDLFT